MRFTNTVFLFLRYSYCREEGKSNNTTSFKTTSSLGPRVLYLDYRHPLMSGCPQPGAVYCIIHHDKEASSTLPTRSLKKPNELPCHAGEVEGLRKKKIAIYRIPLYTLTLQARVKPVPVHIPSLIVIRYFGTNINRSDITLLKLLRLFLAASLHAIYLTLPNQFTITTIINPRGPQPKSTKTVPKANLNQNDDDINATSQPHNELPSFRETLHRDRKSTKALGFVLL